MLTYSLLLTYHSRMKYTSIAMAIGNEILFNIFKTSTFTNKFIYKDTVVDKDLEENKINNLEECNINLPVPSFSK